MYIYESIDKHMVLDTVCDYSKGVSFCQTRSYDMHIVLRKTATEDKNEVGKRDVMRGDSK